MTGHRYLDRMITRRGAATLISRMRLSVPLSLLLRANEVIK